MGSRTSSLVALLATLAFGVACSGAPDALVGINTALTSEATEEMYRIVGQGNYSGDGSQPDLVVNATRTFSGKINGNVVVPRDGLGKIGSVTGIVPPSFSYDYWCVAVALDDQPGVTLLVYINDVVNGVDQVTFGADLGATCETSPIPLFEWNSLVTGNFTGTVKTK